MVNNSSFSQEDLQGHFLFSIDVPGPFRKGEIQFLPDNKCTYREARMDDVSALFSGTYQWNNESKRITINATHACSQSCSYSGLAIKVILDLSNTNKRRVLEADTSTEGIESEGHDYGTENKTGSRFYFIPAFQGREISNPYRLTKLQDSYFSGTDISTKACAIDNSRSYITPDANKDEAQ